MEPSHVRKTYGYQLRPTSRVSMKRAVQRGEIEPIKAAAAVVEAERYFDRILARLSAGVVARTREQQAFIAGVSSGEIEWSRETAEALGLTYVGDDGAILR